MLPIHNKDLHSIRNDDELINFMFSAESKDSMASMTSELTPADSNVANIDHIKPSAPIQTLDTLRTEAEALNIPPEDLKSIKLRELQAIYLADLKLDSEKEEKDGDNNNNNQTEAKSDYSSNQQDDKADAKETTKLHKVPQFLQSNAIFTQIINQYPSYPSAYNNRAQLGQLMALYLNQYQNAEVFKMLTGVELTDGTAQIMKKIKMIQLQALSDLNQSIQLAYQLYPLFAPAGSEGLIELQKAEKIEMQKLEDEWNRAHEPDPFVRPPSKLIVPRVLTQSLCQRAILHKLRGNELLSFADFKQAAALGSTMAKDELHQMNSFEKLNRETVIQMMKQHAADFADVAEVYKGQIGQ